MSLLLSIKLCQQKPISTHETVPLLNWNYMMQRWVYSTVDSASQLSKRVGCAAQRSEICPWPGHVIHWLILGGTWAEPVLPTNTPGKNLMRLLPFRDVGCNQLCLINDINQLRVSGYKYKMNLWWHLFDNYQENASFQFSHTNITMLSLSLWEGWWL